MDLLRSVITNVNSYAIIEISSASYANFPVQLPVLLVEDFGALMMFGVLHVGTTYVSTGVKIHNT